MRLLWRTAARRQAQVLVLVSMLCASCRQVDVVARHGNDADLPLALCGGHGAWELTDAGASCRCEAGFISRNPGWCEAMGPQTGCDNAWCPSGAACELTSARCVTLTPERCGLAAQPLGTRTSTCSNAADAGPMLRCVSGFICVDQDFAVDTMTGAFIFRGSCRPACDPCAPTCSPFEQCVALPEHGGFCTRSRLLGLGESCGAPGTCGGGLLCRQHPTAECRRPCTPDTPEPWAAGDFYTGYHSVNCPANELCTVNTAAVSGGTFYCEGPVGEVGAPCATGVCPFPASCVGGVCTYDCLDTACPPDSTCYQLESPRSPTGVRYSCIRDGALVLNAACAADRNCASSLVCRHNPSPDGPLTCVPL